MTKIIIIIIQKITSGQIYLDECAVQIKKYSSDLNYKTFLEIGTWDGLVAIPMLVPSSGIGSFSGETTEEFRRMKGSTKCFSDGFASRTDDYIFYSLECNKDKCLDAIKLYESNDKIRILDEVIWNDEPSNFYTVFPQCLSNSIFKHWNEVDIANMKNASYFCRGRIFLIYLMLYCWMEVNLLHTLISNFLKIDVKY